ncbi:MAG: RimK family alpha-L-glutamate ligase [Planctomycetia bacterium]|nr:RimK family alpha-L-glutamate ligase [Planctomycetia bacterium]
MRIGILSGQPGWHVQDLLRAAAELDIKATWLDISQLGSNDNLHSYDALLIRSFPAGSFEQTLFRLSLLYHAKRSGQRIINSPASFEACIDKYATTARLQSAGLPVPKTICCQTIDSAMKAFQELGKDIVIKPLFGSEGKGIFRVTDEDAAWRAFSMLHQMGAVMYLQQYIEHGGYDLRVLVLDGQILGAIRRSHAYDWRTNLARGAKPDVVTLSPEDESLALQATSCVGTIIAGVDILHFQCTHSSYLLEINGVPGWKGFTQATGIDVATLLLKCIKNSL